jgi:hypothetical protein
MKSTLIRNLSLAIALGGIVCSFGADVSASVETKAGVASAKVVDESKLSPASQKVAKLLQAGMDEKVIVAYVKNNPAAKAPTAEELIYLNELGVTAPVLTALLTETKKAPAPAREVAAVIPAAPAEKVEVSSNYTPIPGAPPRQVDGSTVVSTPVAAPAPVIVQQPAPQVVYAQPAPVIVHAPPPVYYDPAPRITFGFGFGHFGHFGHHHRHHSIFRHHHHGHFGHRGRHH